MAEVAAIAEEAALQWVTFHLEQETYGVNVMAVKEVLRLADISPVPGSPAYVLGIINIRGDVVSVIDSRQRFGLPAREPSGQSRILVIEIGDQHVGMLVDSVAEVVRIPAAAIEPAPQMNRDEANRYIRGVCERNDELLILLEVDKILTEDELAELDQR